MQGTVNFDSPEVKALIRRYWPLVARHREHFAAPDALFPLSQRDAILSGFPLGTEDSLPQWCSVLYLDPFPASKAVEAVSFDYRLCCIVARDDSDDRSGDTGDLDLVELLLQRMAAGVQVVKVAENEPLMPLLIQVARAVDPAMVVVASQAGAHLREDPRFYSCESGSLRGFLENPGETVPLNGELTAAAGLPPIAGVDATLPEDQQLRMRLAAMTVRLALPGTPVVHWQEVLALPQEIDALVDARSMSAAFHPLADGALLSSEPQLLAFRRDSPEGAVVLCLHNLSRDYVEYRHRKDRFPWPETGVLRELISGDLVVPTSEGALFSLELEPWESLWLSFDAVT